MRLLPFLAIPLAALTLTACTTTTAAPVPVNTASAETSTFATDEEALAAAQAAYAEYLQVSDQILARGGVDSDAILPLVSSDLYQQEQEGFELFNANGWFGAGATAFDTMHVQTVEGSILSVYVCIDHSNTTIKDAQNMLVDTSKRIDRLPLVLGFDFSSLSNPIITKSETWTGTNFC